MMRQEQQKRRAVLIVENDAELRSLTAALFEDEQMDSIECESAEAAPAVLLIGGREVAMIFADVRLRGVKDGIDLAREVKMRWPRLPVILTSGYPRERVGHLPLNGTKPSDLPVIVPTSMSLLSTSKPPKRWVSTFRTGCSHSPTR
jgi:CheY-like chemotaxis protein